MASSPVASLESRISSTRDGEDRSHRRHREHDDADRDERRERRRERHAAAEADDDVRSHDSGRDSHRERGGKDHSGRERGERDNDRERDDRASPRSHRDRRDRDYERERDTREPKRRRSRSPRDYDREHDRRSRDYRGGGRGYDRSPPRRARRSPSYEDRPREKREESPQLSEEQREMRSVFVQQLSARVMDRELAHFFEQSAGPVRDARVIVDRISRRSKGVGYVEFVEQEAVQKALALSGTKLLGIPIIVQYTEAEKNRQARDGLNTTSQGSGLFVGSLNFALTESDIRQVFQPFGPVELVDLQKDPMTGKSKGYAFVKFTDPKDAMTAIEKMNNFNLAGREIKVGFVAERAVPAHVGGGGGGGGGGGPKGDSLSMDDGLGGSLNHISRIELMQKLARTERTTVDIPKQPMMRPNIPQAVTRNVMLKNAFNAEEETERDWDLELRDDVKGECESKYGGVTDIFVLKESQGEIYIRFETVDAATKAVTGLNGRWFGGRQIQAQMINDPLFEAKKP